MQRTFVQLQQDVLFHVHGTSDTTSSNVSSTLLSQVKNAINEAYTDLAERYGLSHLKDEGTIALVDGTSEYDLPQYTTALIEGTLRIEDFEEYVIDRLPEERWNALGGNVNPTEECPRYWDYFGWNAATSRMVIKLHPTPGADQDGKDLIFQYRKTVAPLSADADVPTLPHWMHPTIVYGAIVKKFSSYFTDPRVFAMHVSNWQTGLKKAAKLGIGSANARSDFEPSRVIINSPFRSQRLS